MRVPVEEEGERGELRERLSVDLHKGEAASCCADDEGEQDEEEALKYEVEREDDPERDTEIDELPDRERSGDLILRIDELWDRILHAPSGASLSRRRSWRRRHFP